MEFQKGLNVIIGTNNTEDESTIRLLPFLGMNKLNEIMTEDDGNFQYDIYSSYKNRMLVDMEEPMPTKTLHLSLNQQLARYSAA